MTKTLTIAIPTYNRPEALKRIIAEIAPIVKNYKNISIHVQDNSSEKYQVLNREIAGQYECTYTANEQNIGFGGNLLEIFKRSSSDFLWFLSDDDEVHLESLPALFNKVDALRPNSTLMLPYTCDSKTELYNTSNTWRNSSDLKQLTLIGLPLILFSSAILPIGHLLKKNACILDVAQKYRDNSYIQIILFYALDRYGPSTLNILYFGQKLINYKHSRIGRFTLIDLYRSLLKVYCFLRTENYINPQEHKKIDRDLLRAHLLMCLQHKGGLKIIKDADKHSAFFAIRGLTSFDIKSLVLSLTLMLLPRYLVFKILIARGHTYIE